MEHVLIVSEICVILHVIFIRMRQFGLFEEEILQHEDQFDMTCQLLAQESGQMRERGEEQIAKTELIG